MNQGSDKLISEKSSSTNLSGLRTTDKDKIYSLQGFINKINKSEVNTFGNYYVDFSEMFRDPCEFQNYMKKTVSLFNNDSTEKKQIKNISSNFYLKPQYFSKFSNETLFYIFYYMPRDTLQLLASEELYKRKWRYNTDHAIWFMLAEGLGEIEKSDRIVRETYEYFNPNEWKVMKYVYGPLNPKGFLSENELIKYSKPSNSDK